MTTTSFIFTREQFAIIRDKFRALANTEQLTPADILIYNLLRGLPATRGFTPITNKLKLVNGTDPWLGFDQAKDSLRSMLKYNKASLNTRFGGVFEDAHFAFLQSSL